MKTRSGSKSRKRTTYNEMEEENASLISHYRDIPPIPFPFEVKSLKAGGSDHWYGDWMYYPFVHESEIFIEFSVKKHPEMVFYKKLFEVVINDETMKFVFDYIHKYHQKLSVYFYESLVQQIEASKLTPFVVFGIGDLIHFENERGNYLCEIVGFNDLTVRLLPYQAQQYQVNVILECDSNPNENNYIRFKETKGSIRNSQAKLIIPGDVRQSLGNKAAKMKALAIIYQQKFTLTTARYRNVLSLHAGISESTFDTMSELWELKMDTKFVGLHKSVAVDVTEDQFKYIIIPYLRKEHSISIWREYAQYQMVELNVCDIISIFGEDITYKHCDFVTLKVDKPAFIFKANRLLFEGHIRSIHNETGIVKGDYKTKHEAKLKRAKSLRDAKKTAMQENNNNRNNDII